MTPDQNHNDASSHTCNAANSPEHDPVLDAYHDWLNSALFEATVGEGEFLMWLGDGRWALMAPEGPEVFLIEMKRAEVRQVG